MVSPVPAPAPQDHRLAQLHGGPMDGASIPILDDTVPLPKLFTVAKGESFHIYALRPPHDSPQYDFSETRARGLEEVASGRISSRGGEYPHGAPN